MFDRFHDESKSLRKSSPSIGLSFSQGFRVRLERPKERSGLRTGVIRSDGRLRGIELRLKNFIKRSKSQSGSIVIKSTKKMTPRK